MSTISLARLSRPLRCAQPLRRSTGPSRGADELSLTHWPTSRTYASSQSTHSSLLTSALDQKQRASHSSREDSVGPFQLGISQAALKRGEKAKKWSELSVGGKGKSTLPYAVRVADMIVCSSVTHDSTYYQPNGDTARCWTVHCARLRTYFGTLFKELPHGTL